MAWTLEDASNEYVRALREAYMMARGARLNQIKGTYASEWTNRIHEWSYLWGRIVALEQVLGIPAMLSPERLRQEAIKDAEHSMASRVVSMTLGMQGKPLAERAAVAAEVLVNSSNDGPTPR